METRLSVMLPIVWYRIRRWFFVWKLDGDGELALVMARVLWVVKYKEAAILSFRSPYQLKIFPDAPKRLNIPRGE